MQTHRCAHKWLTKQFLASRFGDTSLIFGIHKNSATPSLIQSRLSATKASPMGQFCAESWQIYRTFISIKLPPPRILSAFSSDIQNRLYIVFPPIILCAYMHNECTERNHIVFNKGNIANNNNKNKIIVYQVAAI